jgi:hypothetical protein
MHTVLASSSHTPITFPSPEFSSVITETTRLGVLLFFCQVRRNFGRAPREIVDVYVSKLLPLLQLEPWQIEGEEVFTLRLWVLALRAMQAKPDDRMLLVGLLKETAQETGLGRFMALTSEVFIGRCGWKSPGQLPLAKSRLNLHACRNILPLRKLLCTLGYIHFFDLSPFSLCSAVIG